MIFPPAKMNTVYHSTSEFFLSPGGKEYSVGEHPLGEATCSPQIIYPWIYYLRATKHQFIEASDNVGLQKSLFWELFFPRLLSIHRLSGRSDFLGTADPIFPECIC